MAPSKKDLNMLTFLSKGKCAFPNCTQSHVDYESKTITGQICHIKGKKPTSARYDKTQTNKQRDSYENLICLCHKHHKIIDDNESEYTVEKLVEMKHTHEGSSDEVPPASISKEIEKVHDALGEIKELLSKGGKENEK